MISPAASLAPIFRPTGCFVVVVAVTFLHCPAAKLVVMIGSFQKIFIGAPNPVFPQHCLESLPTAFGLLVMHEFNLLLGAIPGGGGYLSLASP